MRVYVCVYRYTHWYIIYAYRRNYADMPKAWFCRLKQPFFRRFDLLTEIDRIDNSKNMFVWKFNWTSFFKKVSKY